MAYESPTLGIPTWRGMMRPTQKSALTPAEAQLVEIMQRLDFGTIEGLIVHGGQPVLEPRPRVIRDLKFGTRTGARPEAGLVDFALKSSVTDLITALHSLGNVRVSRLEVRHGLPFRMQVEEGGT
jgi:hypothetical protein